MELSTSFTAKLGSNPCFPSTFVSFDALLVHWTTHVLVNPIDVGMHAQLFDVARHDCVHLLLGALQR